MVFMTIFSPETCSGSEVRHAAFQQLGQDEPDRVCRGRTPRHMQIDLHHIMQRHGVPEQHRQRGVGGRFLVDVRILHVERD